MPLSNYQEPIEKEDLDFEKKLKENIAAPEIKESETKKSQPEMSEAEVPPAEKVSVPEAEIAREAGAEQVSEQIESTRKTIQTQKPAVATNVASDAQMVSQITEYEKKVEKLVQIALEKGPIHAVKVAQHLNSRDDYTLDSLHDKMIEDDLRKQLFQKGLLKEL